MWPKIFSLQFPNGHDSFAAAADRLPAVAVGDWTVGFTVIQEAPHCQSAHNRRSLKQIILFLKLSVQPTVIMSEDVQMSWFRFKRFQLRYPDFSSGLIFQPFSSSPCFISAFSEKCYETAHLHYYNAGESWGRIHLRNVEQCTCAAGEIKCERVRYTSKIQCFVDLNKLEN